MTPSTVTTYEINGTPSAGSAGLAQLASLSSGTMIAAFGTLTSSASSNGFTNSLSSSAVSFAATEVLAGSSVQGSGFDRLSGNRLRTQRQYAHRRGWHADQQRRHQHFHSGDRHHQYRREHAGHAIRAAVSVPSEHSKFPSVRGSTLSARRARRCQATSRSMRVRAVCGLGKRAPPGS